MTLPFLALDKDITLFSSYRTPAKTRYYFEVREEADIEKLVEVYRFAKIENLPLRYLGSGTNILFAFDTYEGIIVRNLLKGVQHWDHIVTVASGELATLLSLRLWKENENSLFQKWVGLPGTIWWAVAGNAGCFGFETKDVVISGKFVDLETWAIFILQNADFQFSYRASILRERPEWFLMEITLHSNLIANDDTDPRTFRSSNQPSGFTCGSFFKNPAGESAGRLIDQAGLKGTIVGGASISPLHGNFFMHDGNGTYQDILELRDLAKSRIRELYNVELQEEVKIITNPSR